MNKEFNKIIDFVLKSEGGYVIDPNDPGAKPNMEYQKEHIRKLILKILLNCKPNRCCTTCQVTG